MQEIFNTLDEQGIEYDEAEIEAAVENLKEHHVPEDEIRRTILKNRGAYESGESVDMDSPDFESIPEIDGDDQFGTLQVQVIDIDEGASERHESLVSAGTLGHGEETIEFTRWDGAEGPALEDGDSYVIEDCVSKTFNGNMTLDFNSATEIESSSHVEASGEAGESFEGRVIGIREDTGLKNPDDGDRKFQIAAVVDNGESCRQFYMAPSPSQQALGMSLEDAIEKAKDALDDGVLEDDVRDALEAHEVKVHGRMMDDDAMWVESFEFVENNPGEDANELLTRARSLTA